MQGILVARLVMIACWIEESFPLVGGRCVDSVLHPYFPLMLFRRGGDRIEEDVSQTR